MAVAVSMALREGALPWSYDSGTSLASWLKSKGRWLAHLVDEPEVEGSSPGGSEVEKVEAKWTKLTDEAPWLGLKAL